MARTEFHVCLSVSGYLRGSKRDLKGLFRFPDGSYMDPDEARAYLRVKHAQGVECLPFGKPCEGFDPKTGCPGHPIPEESEVDL